MLFRSPFDDPPVDAQSTAVLAFAFGNYGRDSSLAEFSPMQFGVVCSIGLDALGRVPWRPGLPADRGNVVDQRQQFVHVVNVGASEDRDQRSAIGISRQC